MKYNPDIHHRRSIRLRGYDYTRAGAYFITLVTHQRECLFGAVVKGEMRVNEWGKMVATVWAKMPDHFRNIVLDEFVVMPNHLHAIVVIVHEPDQRWDDTRDNNSGEAFTDTDASDGRGEALADSAASRDTSVNANASPQRGSPQRPSSSQRPSSPRGTRPRSLNAVVQNFKSITTRQIRKIKTASAPVWQKNYYEHIIRDERALERIRAYIENNPANWKTDSENLK